MDRELLHRRRRIERARARFDDERDGDPDRDRSGEGAALPPITGSWERCAGALGEDAASVPVDVDVDEAEARWDASPIRRGASELLIELADLARSHDYISAVTDAGGRIIWSAAGRTMVRRAEAARFVTGGAWDERAAGTNAPGLALVTGRPETVFAGAHWRAVVHDWVCYAAPIRAPSGEIVGVLDLSATWDRASPLALTTVTSMARLVEQQLRAQWSATPSRPATASTGSTHRRRSWPRSVTATW